MVQNAHKISAGDQFESRSVTISHFWVCLKAVRLEISARVRLVFLAEADPRDPPRSPRPAPHIRLHERSVSGRVCPARFLDNESMLNKIILKFAILLGPLSWP